MSASAVFILDVKGKPLISRNYKGDVPMTEIDHFMPLLMQREEEGVLAPLLSHGRVHFLWVKHSNLYLVATTLKNANASLVYSFLYKTVEETQAGHQCAWCWRSAGGVPDLGYEFSDVFVYV